MIRALLCGLALTGALGGCKTTVAREDLRFSYVGTGAYLDTQRELGELYVWYRSPAPGDKPLEDVAALSVAVEPAPAAYNTTSVSVSGAEVTISPRSEFGATGTVSFRANFDADGVLDRQMSKRQAQGLINDAYARELGEMRRGGAGESQTPWALREAIENGNLYVLVKGVQTVDKVALSYGPEDEAGEMASITVTFGENEVVSAKLRRALKWDCEKAGDSKAACMFEVFVFRPKFSESNGLYLASTENYSKTALAQAFRQTLGK